LAAVEAERAETWEAIPAEFRAAYSRIRLADPVAEVVNNQCQGCRVTVTSSGMQQLRRHVLVMCEHCGRILVMA
jgi:predicted  nucleic acid-binding Zn-ribbon protein